MQENTQHTQGSFTDPFTGHTWYTVPRLSSEVRATAPEFVYFPESAGALVIAEHAHKCETCKAIPVIGGHLARITELEKDADYWHGEFLITRHNAITLRWVLSERVKGMDAKADELRSEVRAMVNAAHKVERNAWYHRQK